VTASCGQTACGDDSNTYTCTASGFEFTSAGCCTCNGSGPGDVPVTRACGQTACGDDNNTYTCTASGFEFSSSGCPQ
jgi:hypothetical protein